MKAILISDHAKWCALMMNGKKKIEVRKSTALYKATQKLIDEYGFADFYVYCSKINRKHYHLIESIDTDTGETEYEIDYYIGGGDYLDWCFDGKVAFKFRCYKVEEIETSHDRFDEEIWYSTGSMEEEDILEHSCLNSDELDNYLYGEKGTAIHVSDLEIFDKPKELSEFRRYGGLEFAMKNADNPLVDDNWNEIVYLTKAPQSFAYIEVGE